MKTYQVDENGYYGEFGGAYVPEILHQCVENLQKKYLEVLESDSFKKEFNQLLRDYVGRPSPLYQAKRLSEMYGCKIYLKREDLNHTGDQQHDRTDLVGPPDGKNPYHSRDGSRTARRGNRYCLCVDEYGMYRLYGQDGCGTPTCKRAENGDVGRDGHPRNFWQHDTERCDQ